MAEQTAHVGASVARSMTVGKMQLHHTVAWGVLNLAAAYILICRVGDFSCCAPPLLRQLWAWAFF